MSEIFGSDAFSPKEIAQRVNDVGVVKVHLPFLSLFMLGVLAGAFIGLGALYFVLIKSDASLGFATSQVVGGLAFSLGLILVIVAGAELFTGNNLLVMAWAGGKITSVELLRNWIIVCFANFVGAAGLAVLVFLSGHTEMNNGAIADQYIKIAMVKTAMPFWSAFFKGVLCNVLVCIAVWMAFAGRTVIDKAIAIVFPISAFVAAGFEHCIANMYIIPLAMLEKVFNTKSLAAETVTWAGFFNNLLPVILGNLVGGSLLVGIVYHIIYRRNNTPPNEK
jgi:formate/nitrite transporter